MSLRVEVSLDLRGFDRRVEEFAPKIFEAIDLSLSEAASGLIEEAKARALPHIAPTARRYPSWYESFAVFGPFSEPNRRVIRVTNFHPWAQALEFGAKPHVILPRNKPVLRFFKEGRFVVTSVVHHPGIPDFRFITQALISAADAFLEKVNAKLGELLASLR